MEQFAPDSNRLLRRNKHLEHDLPNNCFVYVLSNANGRIKIGKASNIGTRTTRLQSYSPELLELIMVWLPFNASKVEAALHTVFAANNVHNEWFEIGRPEYNIWEYMLIVDIAMKTTVTFPILLHSTLLSDIQYRHIPHDDPCWDEPGGCDVSGREFYPTDLFVGFEYHIQERRFTFRGLSDAEDKILKECYFLALMDEN